MGTEFTTIYWRDMLRFVRFRALLFSSLVQPALWMAFFGIAMTSSFDRFAALYPVPAGAVAVPYLTFMAAGVMALTTLFTSLFGGISLLFDKLWGLLREILASPAPRSHVLFGISLSGMTKSFIQVIIIMLFGLLIGVKFFTGLTILQAAVAVAGILLFVGVFSLGFLFLSSTISLLMESPEGLQAVITLLSLPLFFVSNALYPAESFPPFLQAATAANPLTYLVNGIRYFAIGPDFYALGNHYMYTAGDVVLSFLALVLFALVMFAIALRTFSRAVVS
ncbi:MAG: ABC-2 type transporter [Methanoregula sp. PtaU1.Bin051]|nr:MAG: ABC-2 type transporter [Methanoregula sp. PtaU1.Bin051]